MLLAGGLGLLAGCAGTGHRPPGPRSGPAGGWTTLATPLVPPPDGPWRPALPAGCDCPGVEEEETAGRRALADADELMRYGDGGDAIVALEMYLDRHAHPAPRVLVTLGQLYVLAGQGEPSLVPREGPAADTGDWPRNRRRFLHRARRLLRRAAGRRPADAVPIFLLADAARAAGETAVADSLWRVALSRCPCPETLAVLARYQDLVPHPPRQETPVTPVYPPAAAREGVQGTVLLDLLVGADGRIRQVSVAGTPDPRLAGAAAAAFRNARCRPGRVGKYPVWSWLRAEVAFR